MMQSSGGSSGLQAGGEATDLVILVMNDKGARPVLHLTQCEKQSSKAERCGWALRVPVDGASWRLLKVAMGKVQSLQA